MKPDPKAPDNLVALSHFRADVARAVARRAKSLLESPTLATEMAALDPLEAYFAVKELGVESAVPLLLHATEEQLRALVDLDCWATDERPDPNDLATWLAPFAGEGPESLLHAFSSLDGELQVLFLAAHLTIYDARSEEVPDTTEGTARMATNDGFFVLDAPIDEDRDLDPFQLVDAIYRHDVNEAFRLITAAKWELASSLEEEARRFRAARLEDLGFPERNEALSIFAPPSSEPTLAVVSPSQAPSVALPALYAAPLAGSSLLAQALAQLTDPAQLASLEHGIVYLVNAAVVAYGGSPRDLQRVGAIAERARDTLSLGLEVLASPDAPLADPPRPEDVAAAAALFSRWHVRDIFRHGHAATVALAKSARALAHDPVVTSWLEGATTNESLEDKLERAFLRALCAALPLRGGFDAARPDRVTAFGSQRQIAEAASRLDALATRLV